MKRNDYYNLHPFFRNHRIIGLILSILYLFLYPFINTILFIMLFVVNYIREFINEIPEVYRILFSYIKYCIDKKVED